MMAKQKNNDSPANVLHSKKWHDLEQCLGERRCWNGWLARSGYNLQQSRIRSMRFTRLLRSTVLAEEEGLCNLC